MSLFFFMQRRPPRATRNAPLFPSTTLFRSLAFAKSIGAKGRIGKEGPGKLGLDEGRRKRVDADAERSEIDSHRLGQPLEGMFARAIDGPVTGADMRSEEHTSELQSLMRISYAVFCLKKKTKNTHKKTK